MLLHGGRALSTNIDNELAPLPHRFNIILAKYLENQSFKEFRLELKEVFVWGFVKKSPDFYNLDW